MTYKVRITAFADNAAKKLSPEIKKAAKLALKELAETPLLGKELQVELSGFRSYKFLRYRIIFKADAQTKTIFVWAIGHRRDIYENLGGYFLGKK
jgi:mRNA interferase RelE/StbE